MDEWSIATYGDPCRQCGYRWSLSLEEILDVMGDLPAGYRLVTARASGAERHPELAWSVTAYVCHVADNLRIWAERLQGALLGSTRAVRSYDDNLLAEARGYDGIDLQAALWSLTGAVGEWTATVLEARSRERSGPPLALLHPERGEIRLVEVARANCHDAVHHRWDVQRVMDVGSGEPGP